MPPATETTQSSPPDAKLLSPKTHLLNQNDTFPTTARSDTLALHGFKCILPLFWIMIMEMNFYTS